jgi:hypothetical protein
MRLGFFFVGSQGRSSQDEGAEGMRKNWLLSDQRTIGLVATSVIAIPIIMAAIFFVLEGKSLHDVDEILLVSALYGFAEGVLVGIGVSVSNLLIGLVKRTVRNGVIVFPLIGWILGAIFG